MWSSFMKWLGGGMVNAYALSIALVIIGFMEEVYWRGRSSGIGKGIRQYL